MLRIIFAILFCGLGWAGISQSVDRTFLQEVTDSTVLNGAENTADYFPLLQGKKVALVVNQTSMIGNTHLVDSLLSAGISISKIFAPEHGFRGDKSNGAVVGSGKDSRTGIPLISLYGDKFKPSTADLNTVDMVVFDIQDVGVRFYTYISTMHYIMEACAENHIPLVVLDRPNPNGYFVDGPVLNLDYRSFVGMEPIPIVHGLTVGELALMINGEKWLKNAVRCELTVIACKNWDHTYLYQLPVNPSPNLTSMEAIYLYPSLGLFEGTVVSVGRGTYRPFEIFGHPDMKDAPYAFTPKPIAGMSESPPFAGKVCHGYDVSEFSSQMLKYKGELYLWWLTSMYDELCKVGKKDAFWYDSFFDKLAGGNKLRQQIVAGTDVEKIKESWSVDLAAYKNLRKKYLLYKDFE